MLDAKYARDMVLIGSEHVYMAPRLLWLPLLPSIFPPQRPCVLLFAPFVLTRPRYGPS